ncbi:GTP cyclohydrolase II [Nadsonia fulvescens var. elongata DSM 6958]|uniref:GTP cyclohydrolase II n=1 Tax=Nadsonia fulvescens var. elongata DSM 6958 TaxID=857566 RepID=A0A1E3PK33_9ASCO|nr:GTP cyclohydrolase II [Nadsonia fulvescens var. elongata DSM 6958]
MSSQSSATNMNVISPDPVHSHSLSQILSAVSVPSKKLEHTCNEGHHHISGEHSSEASPALALNIGSKTTSFSDIPLISPAFTPNHIPFSTLPIPHDPSKDKASLRQALPEKLPFVECVVRARIPTTNGSEIFLHLYKNDQDNKEHLAIVFGNNIRSKSVDAVRPGETEIERMTRGAYTGTLYPGREKSCDEVENNNGSNSVEDDINEKMSHETPSPKLVRIHSECYTGEIAWSARCDCGEQLNEAARLMSEAGEGIIVYLRQEGRGIGLGEKLKAYNLQDLGADTVQANLLLRHPADARSFSLATAILQDLDQTGIRLLTNNPDKISAVEGKNRQVKVVERVPMIPLAWQSTDGGIRSTEIEGYLKTKIERMGHMLNLQ